MEPAFITEELHGLSLLEGLGNGQYYFDKLSDIPRCMHTAITSKVKGTVQYTSTPRKSTYQDSAWIRSASTRLRRGDICISQLEYAPQVLIVIIDVYLLGVIPRLPPAFVTRVVVSQRLCCFVLKTANESDSLDGGF